MISVMVVTMMSAGWGDLGPVLARPGAGGQERGPGEVCEGEGGVHGIMGTPIPNKFSYL